MVEISKSNFDDLVKSNGLEHMRLGWTYSKATKEMLPHIKRHLAGRARKSIETPEHGEIECYRLLVHEIGSITHRTQANMTNAITGQIRKGSVQELPRFERQAHGP